MNCVDVNVLVNLSNGASPSHAVARDWLDSTVDSGEAIVIPESAAVGYTRIVTDRRIMPHPVSPESAFGFLDALVARPRVTMFAAKSSTYERFKATATSLGLRGKDIPDAWLAAVARDLGAAVVTFDRGFRRFPDLRVMLLEAPTP